MIKLEHDIELKIGDKKFKVKVASELSKEQEEKLINCAKEKSKEHNKNLKKAGKLNRKIGKLRTQYELNQKLITDGTEALNGNKLPLEESDKALIRKQLNLVEEIDTLQDEIDVWNDSLKETSTGEKETLELRYDLLVSGADSTALKEFCISKNINFGVLFKEIAELTKEDGVKK